MARNMEVHSLMPGLQLADNQAVALRFPSAWIDGQVLLEVTVQAQRTHRIVKLVVLLLLLKQLPQQVSRPLHSLEVHILLQDTPLHSLMGSEPMELYPTQRHRGRIA